MSEEQGGSEELELLVALRVRLAPSILAQTQPLRATLQFADAGRTLDLVKLVDVDPATFATFKNAIETLILYDNAAHALAQRYQSLPSPFSIALGSNQSGLLLDTDTKDQPSLVAAAIPPITLADWDAWAAANGYPVP